MNFRLLNGIELQNSSIVNTTLAWGTGHTINMTIVYVCYTYQIQNNTPATINPTYRTCSNSSTSVNIGPFAIDSVCALYNTVQTGTWTITKQNKCGT